MSDCVPILVSPPPPRIIVLRTEIRCLAPPQPRILQASQPAPTILAAPLAPVVVIPQGLRGRPGTAEGLIHTQSSAASTWTIAHNLGYRPNVELRTVGGQIMDGQVTHNSVNLITVQFAYAIAGTVRML